MGPFKHYAKFSILGIFRNQDKTAACPNISTELPPSDKLKTATVLPQEVPKPLLSKSQFENTIKAEKVPLQKQMSPIHSDVSHPTVKLLVDEFNRNMENYYQHRSDDKYSLIAPIQKISADVANRLTIMKPNLIY